MASASWVADVGEADFDRAVLEESRRRPVVVDFWAPWCGPCRLLGPLLEQLARERGGDFLLAKVNIDEAQELAGRYGIQAIPAVKAFRDGRPVLEFVGLLPEDQLRQFVDEIFPSAAERLVRQAAGLEADRPAEAETLYRQAHDAEPANEAAALGLARVLLARGRDEEAGRLLENLGPGGEQGAEYERLAALLDLHREGQDVGDVAAARRRLEADPENAERRYELGRALAAAGDYPAALEQLLAAAERDRKLAAARVRELMVKIFHVVGVRSPLADEYRDKLTRVLY